MVVQGGRREHQSPSTHKMADELLLERMLTGQTQNANESFNNLIWVFCPKNVFVVRPKVLCALRSAVCQFNSGSRSYGGKLKLLGLPVSDTQASHMNQKDRERVRKAEKAAEVQVRDCLLYTSPSPRDLSTSRMPSSA